MSIYPEATQQQLNFTEQVCNEMYQTMIQNDKKIHVVPARCGFGKGNTQKAFLNHLLDVDNDDWGNSLLSKGAIFVTDRKSRLEELYSYKNISKHSYWIRAESDCQIPLQEQFVEQQRYPVLLMTTQRYFQMDSSAIRALKKWRDEEDKEFERSVVIFDEKPYFLETMHLDIKNIDRVEAALFQLPENNLKDTIIGEFTRLKQEIFQEWSVMTEYLQKHSMKNYTWIVPDRSEVTETKFYKLARQVDLSDNILNIITAIRRRKLHGCFYVNQKKGANQDRYYKIPMDNQSKFLTQEFCYWIFDASACNDIEYKLLADRLPFTYFEVDDKKSENCQVVLYDYNTSRSSLTVDREEKLIGYVETTPVDTVIITYSTLESKVRKETQRKKTMHFGDTKGYNDFKDAANLLQIGLNRQDDLYYLGVYLELYPEELEKINQMAQDDIVKFIEETTELSMGDFVNQCMQEIMISKISTDFEQNIFRTKLRQFGNNDFVRIEVICSKRYEKVLTDTLKRYEIIYEIDEEEFHTIKRPREGSHADKIWNYLDSLASGMAFTTKDIYAATGLTKKQFEKASATYGITEELAMYRVGRGRYVK